MVYITHLVVKNEDIVLQGRFYSGSFEGEKDDIDTGKTYFLDNNNRYSDS